jgi:tRNA nucleotidyltransferase (CCA-adding enzyme)
MISPLPAVRLSGFKPDASLNRLGDAAQVYVVGGAVRDELMRLPSCDRDWLVVGSTPEAMKAAGFKPVGADFPVFLHPDTQEEYALARTERKSGPGYKGFVFHADPCVRLEEDLLRRDLTINAMAMDAHGQVFDPWGGHADLQNGWLRHVSPAFAEDPVRILRLARFAARFPNFCVVPETLAFCQRMVAAGEGSALVAERVWQELSRLLMSVCPARGVDVMYESGVLAAILNVELADLLHNTPVLNELGAQSAANWSLEQRWAFWGVAAGLSLQQQHWLSLQLKVPTDCADLLCMAVSVRPLYEHADSAEQVHALFAQVDLYRRAARFHQLETVLAAACAHEGKTAVLSSSVWRQLAQTVEKLPMGEVARQAAAQGVPIPEAVSQARQDLLGQALRDLLK